MTADEADAKRAYREACEEEQFNRKIATYIPMTTDLIGDFSSMSVTMTLTTSNITNDLKGALWGIGA